MEGVNEMKVSARMRSIMRRLAAAAQRQRELNRALDEEFDRCGIETNSQEFWDAFGYLEGDCDEQPLIDYIESLKEGGTNE